MPSTRSRRAITRTQRTPWAMAADRLGRTRSAEPTGRTPVLASEPTATCDIGGTRKRRCCPTGSGTAPRPWPRATMKRWPVAITAGGGGGGARGRGRAAGGAGGGWGGGCGGGGGARGGGGGGGNEQTHLFSPVGGEECSSGGSPYH